MTPMGPVKIKTRKIKFLFLLFRKCFVNPGNEMFILHVKDLPLVFNPWSGQGLLLFMYIFYSANFIPQAFYIFSRFSGDFLYTCKVR